MGVKSVTASYDTPEYVAWGDGISATGKNGPVEISLNAMPIDLDFAQTLGMQFAAGRDFQKYDFDLMDTTNNSANYKLPYIINETLAKMIGWTPEEAIGKTIEHRALGPIVGVLKDFHFQSLHQPIGPLLQFLDKDASRKLLVKIEGSQMQETLKGLEQLFATRMPGQPFNFHFLDDDYNKLYMSEQRTTSLFKAAAFIAPSANSSRDIAVCLISIISSLPAKIIVCSPAIVPPLMEWMPISSLVLFCIEE